MLLSKRVLLLLLPLLLFSPIQGFSQVIISTEPSSPLVFKAKVGDSRQYKLSLLNLRTNQANLSDSLMLENGSLAVFNNTNGMIFTFTVVKIIGKEQIYIQESLTVKYQIGISHANQTTSYGKIKGQPEPVNPLSISFLEPLGPSFPNKTMTRGYLLDVLSNSTYAIMYSISGDYYTVTSRTTVYPFNVINNYTVNWKTGWLQSIKNQRESIEIIKSNLIIPITNTPINLIGLGIILVIVVTGVILFTKYKRYKKSEGKEDNKLSFIGYTKIIIKPKKEKQKSRELIDTDKALNKIEKIIEENKEK